jgi:2-hydroxychromene-2-carboxylate isomerase
MVPLAEQGFRGDYVRRDVARLARRLGLDFATATAPPGTSLALARVFHAIDILDPALAVRFAEEAFTATFAKGERLDSVEAAQALAARIGPSAGAAATHALGSEARAALRAATQDAIMQGVFGAPFFIVDGEPFWGQDRLPLMEAWLREGPW